MQLPGYSLGILAKLILVFLLLYAVLPVKALKNKITSTFTIEKFFIGFVHANFITIMIVHFLSFIKIYEFFSLIFCYYAVYILYKWLNSKYITKENKPILNIIFLDKYYEILDMYDSPKGLRKELSGRLKSSFLAFLDSIRNKFKSFISNPLNSIALLIILAVGAYIRFHHSINHLYLGASDSYVHLAWVKYLGNNDIYKDGIYPYGYHAIISAINKIFFIDPYFIVRFIGAMEGIIILLSIYYLVKVSFNNKPWLAWVSLGLYVAGLQLPIDVWRQVSALPQEYAIIFFLPGMHSFRMYLKDDSKHYFILSLECFAITLLVHPYVTVFLAIGYIITYLVYYERFLNFRFVLKTFIGMALAGFVGILPLIVGAILGMEFHGSLGYIQRVAELPDKISLSEILRFNEPSSALKLLIPIIMIFILILILIRLKLRKNMLNEKEKFRIILIFILLAITFYLLYRAPYLGLPVLMDINRIGIFLSIVVVIIFVMPFIILDFFGIKKAINMILHSLIIAGLCLITVSYSKITIPQGFQLEYDEAVYNYVTIKRDYQYLNWTIISPVEQYQQSLGYGWHYNLWELVKKLEDGEDLTFPTDYVFIFVEKKPLWSDEYVSEEYAKQGFPEEQEESVQYYYGGNRIIIQSIAYYWAESFMQNNDNMKIYFDNDIFRVYVIEQDWTNPVVLRKYRG